MNLVGPDLEPQKASGLNFSVANLTTHKDVLKRSTTLKSVQGLTDEFH